MRCLHHGMVMASLSQNITLPLNVVGLKAIAMSKAPDFSPKLGFKNDILKGDSEIVMKALQDDSSSLASFGLLIRDAHLIADLFTCISFLHVGRDGNSIAHNLARHAHHVTGFFCLDGGCSISYSCYVSG